MSDGPGAHNCRCGDVLVPHPEATAMPAPLTWQEGHPPDDERRVYVRMADGTWTVWDKGRETGVQSLVDMYPGLVTHWCPAPEPCLPEGTRDWVGLAEECRREDV